MDINQKDKLTRIEKYSKLRNKIDQEIKMIFVKRENDRRIQKFQERIDKIDSNLFDKARSKINDDFSDFKSLIDVQKVSNKKDIDHILNDLKKWKDVIESLKEKYAPSENLNDYLVNLNSEKQIERKITKNHQKYLNKDDDVSQIITNKNLIIDHIKATKLHKKQQKNEKFNLLKVNHQIVSQIRNYNKKFNFLIDEKKRKTKWLFWLILTFSSLIFLLALTFLIIYLNRTPPTP